MTKNQAKKEAAKIKKEQEKNAKANRDAAANNAASLQDGTAFVYGPTWSINTLDKTLPGLPDEDFGDLEFKVTIYEADFNGEKKIFKTKPDAKKWCMSQKKNWTKEHGKTLSLSKIRKQVQANIQRIQKLTSIAQLPAELKDNFQLAIDALDAVQKQLPEPPAKKSAKAKNTTEAAA